jgi:30S ribosome assembly GTPase
MDNVLLPDELQSCNGCGCELQTEYEDREGYVPAGKLSEFLHKYRSRMQPGYDNVEEKRLQASRRVRGRMVSLDDIEDWEWEHVGDIEVIPEMRRRAPARKRKTPTLESSVLCSRCYQLKHYGFVRGTMDVARADEFRALMQSHIDDDPRGVVVKIVDIFDLDGSWIPGFDQVVTRYNIVILVANKVDVLPTVGRAPIVAWLRKEAEFRGVNPSSIHLVSASTGEGIDDLVEQIRLSSVKVSSGMRPERQQEREAIFERRQQQVGLAQQIEEGKPIPDDIKLLPKIPRVPLVIPPVRNVYIVGSANVGKSSIINVMLKKRALKGKHAQTLTESPLPGTTLESVSFPFVTNFAKQRERRKLVAQLFDTPGVIQTHQYISHLTVPEISCVLPSKRIHPSTYRLKLNKSIALGGLAIVELVAGRPFFATVFASHKLSVHLSGSTDHHIQVLERNVGTAMFTPPFTKERTEEIGLLGKIRTVEYEVQGKGWLNAAADIVLPGIGWITFTGSGKTTVRVTVPLAIEPAMRPPILPLAARGKKSKPHGNIKHMRS